MKETEREPDPTGDTPAENAGDAGESADESTGDADTTGADAES